MPVVTVTAPALAGPELAAALRELAGRVATALELPATDVYVTALTSAASVIGTDQVAALPVVLLHGGRRSRSAMEAARDAAAEVVARRWDCPPDRVWAQWILADDEP
jgi:hypothetical protein